MTKFFPCSVFLFFILVISAGINAQVPAVADSAVVKKKKSNPKIIYGTASFYANKFNGLKTATGEIFSQQKMTAACNVLPLGTWIKVTNIRNGRSVVVKINDRLHPKMKRVVDLTRAAAQKLNYVSSGLTKVKVEVLGKKKPSD
jgi:rare lipoprotein A